MTLTIVTNEVISLPEHHRDAVRNTKVERNERLAHARRRQDLLDAARRRHLALERRRLRLARRFGVRPHAGP